MIGRPRMQKLMQHKAFYCVKVSIKHGAKVICKFDRLRTAHSKSQKSHMCNAKLIGCPCI